MIGETKSSKAIMESSWTTLMLLLVLAVTASSLDMVNGQKGFDFEEHQGSSMGQLEIAELAPQQQANSESFESIREKVSSCNPRVDKSCKQKYLPVCGSNGETYNNEEELLRAKLEEPRLRKLHEGMCMGLESQSGDLDESSFMPQGFESIGQDNFSLDEDLV